MIDLKMYGYIDRNDLNVDGDKIIDGCIPARVIEVHRELYKVVTEHGETNARLKGSLYNKTAVAEDFPAVGDFVMLRYNEFGDSQIVKVGKRKSKFSRPDYSGHAVEYAKNIVEQVVAANFDYVFILASLNMDYNINRILRYITVAWESGGVPVVILTKADLVEDYEEYLKQIQKNAIGVEVYAISSKTGKGLEQIKHYLIPAKTIVFLGSSGVGKSSLVNALAEKEIMEVKTIREDDSKGRHTTTHRQLILLKNGVMIIDTPGMRELGMWDIDEGLFEAFSDVEELIQSCRFSDCTHKSEPGCAVLEAIQNGALEEKRWKNYQQLKNEAKFTENKSNYLREKKAFFKKLNQSAKTKIKR